MKVSEFHIQVRPCGSLVGTLTCLIFHTIAPSSNSILKTFTPIIHVFQLHQDEAGQEELDGEENQNIAACNIWELPNIEFDGLWDT